MDVAGPQSCRLLRTLEGHTAAVLSVAFTKNGRYILSASQDKTLRLWNHQEGKHVKTFTGPHNYEVSDAAIVEDNSKFASCGGDKHAFLWDVTTGQVIRRFAGHDRKVNALAFGPHDDVLLTASHDKTVRIWDARARSRGSVQVLDEAKDSVLCVRVAGDEILTGSADGGLRRYDVRQGQLVTDQLLQPIGSIGLSSDAQCILVSTLDSSIRLIERDTGNELARYTGHTNTRFKVQSTLDPSDSIVVSGSEDNRICFWDLVEASMFFSVAAEHRGAVFCARFFEDTLVTASADGVIKVWTAAFRQTGPGGPETAEPVHLGLPASFGRQPSKASEPEAAQAPEAKRRRGERGKKHRNRG